MGLHQNARYVVVFKGRIKPEVPGYYELADELEQMAMDGFGCVARENFRNPNREGVSLSYWKSLDDIKAWKEAARHRMAHKIGAERWYEDYALEICEIHRSYKWGTMIWADPI
jgi:Uncharacterized enzyme involved in biosynthesis of extracellular polysaccharides